MFAREYVIVYHLSNFSGKSGWKVNGTRIFVVKRGRGRGNLRARTPAAQARLFESFHQKISGSNGTSEKVRSCLSGQNIPNGNSCSISSKPSLIPGSGLRFLVNGTDLYKW